MEVVAAVTMVVITEALAVIIGSRVVFLLVKFNVSGTTTLW